MTILAFDLGGTAVKFGVLTTAGEILEKVNSKPRIIWMKCCNRLWM